ncbi:MAG TPA: flippase [Candidatus Paceibacterota bacterium]
MIQRIKNFLFKNTSDKQTVAKNTFWLITSEIIGRLFKLAVVVFATRELGIENWGIFSYGLAFVSFFYILGDFGVNTFITREMSKDNASKYKYLATSFIIKMGLLIILFTISLIVGPYLGKIKLGVPLLTTLSLLFFSDCVREFALSVNRASGKMELEAFSKIGMNSLIAILGIILIATTATPLSLAIAYAVGSIIATVFMLWTIRGEFKKIQWVFSKEALKIIYAFSWPITIISMFSFIFNIDSIMLGQLKSATDVGLYSAAQRIVQFIAILPAFIATSLFPLLSKNEADNSKMVNIFERVLVLLCAAAIPLAIGGFLLSTELMSFLFGSEYGVGGLTLGILMISLLASFPNTILINVIFSKNLQRAFIAATAWGVLVNIILNFLLIPRYGAIGAALSLTITQLLIMTINWQKLKKIIPFSVIPKIGILLLSSLIMALGIVALQWVGMPVIITVIIATVLYVSCLLILKERSLTEILLLLKK